MSGIEIALIVIGLVIFVASFVFSSASDKKESEKISVVLTNKQREDIKNQILSVFDEQIEAVKDKTETSLDKLSTRKMNEMNEYSDTILGEINRNHNEVMFLYDMLNEKKKEINNTVRDLNVAKKKLMAEYSVEAGGREGLTNSVEAVGREGLTNSAGGREGLSNARAEQMPAGSVREQGGAPARTFRIDSASMSPSDSATSSKTASSAGRTAKKAAAAAGAEAEQEDFGFMEGQELLENEKAQEARSNTGGSKTAAGTAGKTGAGRKASGTKAAAGTAPKERIIDDDGAAEPQESPAEKPRTSRRRPAKTGKTAAERARNTIRTETEREAKSIEGLGGGNSNEKILELSRQGKTNMEIAKTLGLGIGEVKLVVDLFKGGR